MCIFRAVCSLAATGTFYVCLALPPQALAVGLGITCDSQADCFGIPEPDIGGQCVHGYCCDSDCGEGRCDVQHFEGHCISTSGIDGCIDDGECASGFCRDGRCCVEDCAHGFCGNDSGTCVALRNLGGFCGVDAECASGFCTNLRCCAEACPDGSCDFFGMCGPLLDLGEECEANEQCNTQVCDRFAGVCCHKVCSITQDCLNPWAIGRCTPFLLGCIADCDGDGGVTIGELITSVSIALGIRPIDDCMGIDYDGNGRITIDELIIAVLQAMTECART